MILKEDGNGWNRDETPREFAKHLIYSDLHYLQDSWKYQCREDGIPYNSNDSLDITRNLCELTKQIFRDYNMNF